MEKLKAVRRVLLASNYIVITDTTTDGSVSPLYAEKFKGKLQAEIERQELATYKYKRTIEQLADQLLPDTE